MRRLLTERCLKQTSVCDWFSIDRMAQSGANSGQMIGKDDYFTLHLTHRLEVYCARASSAGIFKGVNSQSVSSTWTRDYRCDDAFHPTQQVLNEPYTHRRVFRHGVSHTLDLSSVCSAKNSPLQGFLCAFIAAVMLGRTIIYLCIHVCLFLFQLNFELDVSLVAMCAPLCTSNS